MTAANRVDLVQSLRDRRDFLNVVGTIYRDDPNPVRLPYSEELARIGPKNPYFDHAEVALFVARNADGRAVGRISAQIDTLDQGPARTDERRGHFGFLEAVDAEVMRGLVAAAETWLRERGVTVLSGPYCFSINEEAGLLIEGHGDPPRVLMNYAPPWYGPALEKLGFTKAKDLLAFHFDCGREMPPHAKQMAGKASTLPGLRHRILDKRRFAAEMRTVAALFNDAWSQNWGFVPMTEAEITHMAASLKPILPPELVRIVEIDGDPIGMIVILPDVHEALAGLHGRLLPFGWAKLLWRLKIRGLTRARVVLMGVSRAWKNDLRGAAIAALLVEQGYEQLSRMGYRKLEVSWILEDNIPMLRLIELLGGEAYKRYRIYEKQLP